MCRRRAAGTVTGVRAGSTIRCVFVQNERWTLARLSERTKPCGEHSEIIFLPHGPKIRSTRKSNSGRGVPPDALDQPS